MKFLSRLLPWTLILSLSFYCLSAQGRESSGYKGTVVTAHDAATQAGIEMLRLGGSAADAAVAAGFVLAVVEPYSSGLGGGGFALTKFRGKIQFIDFREVAPKGASRDMFVVDGIAQGRLSTDGALAAGVPGAAAGYLALQAEDGRLERTVVLAPAIRFAREGFAATAKFVRAANHRHQVLSKDPEAAKIFLRVNPRGAYSVPKVGERIVQEDLAQSLELMAALGAKAFYEGPIAKKLVADMVARKGLITASDLRNYRIRYQEPLVGSYRGHAVVSSPPPSSGGQILLTILNVMENLPQNRAWRSIEEIQTYLEASKRAFADRALLGDPKFLPYLKDLIPGLIAKDRGKLLYKLTKGGVIPSLEIPPAQGAPKYFNVPDWKIGTHRESPSTSHLSVIDVEGNAVSLTTTVNYSFGAGIVAKGTGIIWNDQMDDFAIAPGIPNTYGIVGSEANAVAPGKVPLSSMSPTLVFQGGTPDGALKMVLGSPGGSRIPTTVAQAIINAVDHRAGALEAISEGRIHHQHLPDMVFVEPRALDETTFEALQARGYALKIRSPWSNATLILVDPETGLITAAADPRGVGTAAAE
ncbi:MAG: gamma-glutamyltransferase [Myxococcota bacterium]|nr:gamma-glutamyltransferase [Myxococcota bacterium]